MNQRMAFVLVGSLAMLMGGCASFDKSMESDAVDIHDDPPLSSPFTGGPSPSPSPAGGE